jgi:hypothetical protein
MKERLSPAVLVKALDSMLGKYTWDGMVFSYDEEDGFWISGIDDWDIRDQRASVKQTYQFFETALTDFLFSQEPSKAEMTRLLPLSVRLLRGIERHLVVGDDILVSNNAGNKYWIAGTPKGELIPYPIQDTADAPRRNSFVEAIQAAIVWRNAEASKPNHNHMRVALAG